MNTHTSFSLEDRCEIQTTETRTPPGGMSRGQRLPRLRGIRLQRSQWFRCGLAAVAIALALLNPVEAKLNAAPGKDGAPPDPEVEAAVDTINNGLGGPKDGQSVESWTAEMHDAQSILFGHTTDLEPVIPFGTPHGGTMHAGTTVAGTTLAGASLCQSPIHIWTSSTSSETVADAIADASVYNELKQTLADHLKGWLLDAFWESGLEIGHPIITQLTCGTGSVLSVSVPLTARLSGVPVGDGVLILDSINPRYQEIADTADPFPYEWCFDLYPYETTGFTPWVKAGVNFTINNRLPNAAFCHHAWD